MVYGKKISISTKGFSNMREITGDVQNIISNSGIKDGLVNISVVGSTASVSTIEYEPALVEDFRDNMEEIIPSTKRTRHCETWGDDNGFSHIRATLMGPGITMPLSDGELVLGTWQQLVLIDHDNRPRSREVFVQIIGE
jgi:secondary thiamine-phosphate synthase enzyme